MVLYLKVYDEYLIFRTKNFNYTIMIVYFQIKDPVFAANHRLLSVKIVYFQQRSFTSSHDRILSMIAFYTIHDRLLYHTIETLTNARLYKLQRILYVYVSNGICFPSTILIFNLNSPFQSTFFVSKLFFVSNPRCFQCMFSI